MTAVNTRANHVAKVDRLSNLQAQIDDLQTRIATTRKLATPADDPVSHARATVLRRDDASSNILKRAIDAGARRLTATDTALEGVSNLVQRARELALQGNTATVGPADRTILAAEVKELAEQFAGLAEARGSDGERLFGGAAASAAAYVRDAAGTAVWQGGGEAPRLAIGDALVATGIDGPQAFGVTDAATGAEDLFKTFDNLAAALVDADPRTRTAALEKSLAAIDGHVDRLATARATAGARLARLDSEAYRLDRSSLATKSDLSKLADLDLTEGVARLQRLVTVLQAAQGSFTKVANLSLWDLLR
ncbi:hypothetical protein IP88_00535 [alpha proteobacterium AAP81b]|nr:hypothetical protein IP88_00535 [alpha proteobacterium AAP81b]